MLLGSSLLGTAQAETEVERFIESCRTVQDFMDERNMETLDRSKMEFCIHYLKGFVDGVKYGKADPGKPKHFARNAICLPRSAPPIRYVKEFNSFVSLHAEGYNKKMPASWLVLAFFRKNYLCRNQYTEAPE